MQRKDIEKHLESLGFHTHPTSRNKTFWNKDDSTIQVRVDKEDGGLVRIFDKNPDFCTGEHFFGYALFRGVISSEQELEQVLKMIGHGRY